MNYWTLLIRSKLVFAIKCLPACTWESYDITGAVRENITRPTFDKSPSTVFSPNGCGMDPSQQQTNQGNTQYFNGYAYIQLTEIWSPAAETSSFHPKCPRKIRKIRPVGTDWLKFQFGQMNQVEKLSQLDGPTQVVQIAFESIAEQVHNALPRV